MHMRIALVNLLASLYAFILSMAFDALTSDTLCDILLILDLNHVSFTASSSVILLSGSFVRKPFTSFTAGSDKHLISSQS